MFAGILGPIALILLGAVMVAAGINYQLGMIGWTGAALLAAGALWGALVFFFYAGGDWW